MSTYIEVQRELADATLPDDSTLTGWAEAVLEGRQGDTELVVRIVDRPEIRALNNRYRGRDKPTNVLSFPSELPPEIESDLLGDLVICAPVVEQEAQDQGKSVMAHWAHMVVHGVLHLVGYDHQNEQEAGQMEALEVQILLQLGYPNPYRVVDDIDRTT